VALSTDCHNPDSRKISVDRHISAVDCSPSTGVFWLLTACWLWLCLSWSYLGLLH